MIDAERWVLAEAWIANGLRLRWGASFEERDGGYQEDKETRQRYRYEGFGEWSVARSDGTYRPLGLDVAPCLSTSAMRHELAHYMTATEEQRQQRNFGLVGEFGPDAGQEESTLTAERVIDSMVRAASRIIGMAMLGEQRRSKP